MELKAVNQGIPAAMLATPREEIVGSRKTTKPAETRSREGKREARHPCSPASHALCAVIT